MEKPEFTYMIEPGNNRGYIWLFEGKQEKEDELLFFYNEKDLLEALKQNEKGAIFVGENNSILLQEGKRLSEKLNLQFLHS